MLVAPERDGGADRRPGAVVVPDDPHAVAQNRGAGCRRCRSSRRCTARRRPRSSVVLVAAPLPSKYPTCCGPAARDRGAGGDPDAGVPDDLIAAARNRGAGRRPGGVAVSDVLLASARNRGAGRRPAARSLLRRTGTLRSKLWCRSPCRCRRMRCRRTARLR